MRALGKEAQPSRRVFRTPAGWGSRKSLRLEGGLPAPATSPGAPGDRLGRVQTPAASGGLQPRPLRELGGGRRVHRPWLAAAPRLLHREHGPAPLRDVHQVWGRRVPDPPGQRPGVSAPLAPARGASMVASPPPPPLARWPLLFILFLAAGSLLLCGLFSSGDSGAAHCGALFNAARAQWSGLPGSGAQA